MSKERLIQQTTYDEKCTYDWLEDQNISKQFDGGNNKGSHRLGNGYRVCLWRRGEAMLSPAATRVNKDQQWSFQDNPEMYSHALYIFAHSLVSSISRLLPSSSLPAPSAHRRSHPQ